MTKNIIEISNLKKSYGSRWALQGISFTVQRGTIHGFIGPNGAGKSTLIKSLMGGIIPNSGKIYLADRKGGGDEYINQKIGYMFEKVKFSDDLTVGDFIYLAGQARRIPLPQVENRLRKSDLNNHRKKKCQQLSTGWNKILLYFVAVMHDPDILVLDEPTSGLDPSYRGILLKQLEQVRKRGGTVLISSHILSDLQKLVDAVTLINKGKIVYTGKKPADIEEMYEKMVSKKKITDKEGQTCLVVSGKLILTPERAQSCELLVAKIELVNSTANDYPLQKKNIPLEVVRNFPHLRTKTNYFLALFRLRHNVSQAIQEFFHQEGFYCVPTPLITSNDTEGAGELFNITTNEKEPFFPKPAKLTVSGQLQAEALAQGLGKVYTFSPCFRAEKSHTTRHLAEFWMVEPEMTFADLTGIINLAEKMIKQVVNYVLDNNIKELEFFENYTLPKKELVKKLKEVSSKIFVKVDYDQCIEILKKKKEIFVFNDIKWGIDLQSEHEKYLCQYFDNSPVFVINYPLELKAFYMKNNSNKKTVACFDLLFPEVGELIGGSVREDNYQILIKKAQRIGLDINNLSWYFDLRKSGYAPSGGFGLGLERLIMFISGTENIRDTIAFPRFPGKLEF